MQPLPVVIDFDVFEQCCLTFLPGFPYDVLGKFSLKRGPEALGNGAIPTVTFLAHRGQHSVSGERILIVIGGVLSGLNRSWQHRLFGARVGVRLGLRRESSIRGSCGAGC